MVLRDSKGKRRKSAKQAKDEARLASKLQDASLKVHGDPPDPPKKAPAVIKLFQGFCSKMKNMAGCCNWTAASKNST